MAWCTISDDEQGYGRYLGARSSSAQFVKRMERRWRRSVRMKMRGWLYHRSTVFFVFPLTTSRFRLMANPQPVAKPFP